MTPLKNYPPFLLEKSGKTSSPVIIASPHSGTFYPERFFHLTDLKLSEFQQYEDACVDKLFSFAPAMGLTMISAVYARAWIDLNRHPLELDPTMFSDKIPSQAKTESAWVKNGFGVIPRQLNDNKLIYKEKLRFAVEQSRLTDIHFPYHNMLKNLIKKNLNFYGKSLLLDLHSMPLLPANRFIKGKMPDFVLGTSDNHSCCGEITRTIMNLLQEMGYFVTLNLPYSGAYTTLYYGRPESHSHVIQMEIGRHLYWDAKQHAPSSNFNTLWFNLSLLMEHLLTKLPSIPL